MAHTLPFLGRTGQFPVFIDNEPCFANADRLMITGLALLMIATLKLRPLAGIIALAVFTALQMIRAFCIEGAYDLLLGITRLAGGELFNTFGIRGAFEFWSSNVTVGT